MSAQTSSALALSSLRSEADLQLKAVNTNQAIIREIEALPAGVNLASKMRLLQALPWLSCLLQQDKPLLDVIAAHLSPADEVEATSQAMLLVSASLLLLLHKD